MQSSTALPNIPSRRGGPTDPSHDATLRRGIIDTAVTPKVATAMTVLFLLMVYAVPLSQAVMEKLAGEDSILLELFRHVPDQARLHQFEKDLEEGSYLKDFFQPRAQLWLSRWGRAGNKRAVVGREGWLYYAPGIAFVTGPSFVDANVIRTREKKSLDGGDGTLFADPRPAIFALHDMLARRGIQLVLFPVPDKAMLEPATLHARRTKTLGPLSDGAAARIPVARSIGWQPFADELRAHGVALFDPTPESLSPSDNRFLVEDTHWTPAWMEEVAKALARFVKAVAPLSPRAAGPSLHVTEERVQRVGDLVDMLKLPEHQNLFLPELALVHPVKDEAGADWEPDARGDVLLLGDSFTNIYSLEPMGWGTAAGLAPHLSVALGRPIDVIAQNDSGAFATRQALGRELAAGEDRLAGKSVVIWQFASRELAVGNWKPVEWTSAPRAAGVTGQEGTPLTPSGVH